MALTKVQGVCVWPVGEGSPFISLVQYLLLHLGNGVAVQNFGLHRLGLVPSPLHLDI